jgi:hypothetical protein
MNSSQITKVLAVAVVASAVSCFKSEDSGAGGTSTAPVMALTEVTNGFGRILPYVIPIADEVTGGPTAQLIEIRSLDDLYNNPPTSLNPVLPPVAWPSEAINPANAFGNHFVVVSFTGDIDETSVLDPSASGLANNGLTGAITVVAYDKVTGESAPVDGRAFINGVTYYGSGPTRERWVTSNGYSAVSALTFLRDDVAVSPGIGFPGTSDAASGVPNGAFVSAGSYISKNTFMYVVDSDNDLTTYETFPANKVIRVVIKGTELGVVEGGVRSSRGFYLENGGIATSAVAGDDGGAPLPLLDGPGGRIVTSPQDLDIDVPCDEEMYWSFDEACQPHTVGPIPSAFPPSISSEFSVEFYPPVPQGDPLPGTTISMAYTVSPISPFNFTEFLVAPVVPFPGQDPFGAQSQAKITYWHKSAEDLFGNQDSASIGSSVIGFAIGSDCPGLVNAPIMPGAIMIASSQGMKVLDLDGFGQGTGDPTHDFIRTEYNVTYDSENNPASGDISKFPFNPNLALQGIFPPLTANTTTLAGGSRGVFTLTQNTNLSTSLTDSTMMGSISDIMVGHPLDLAYNNYECISGGQNNCASLAYQTTPLSTQGGRGNNISNAPHPNPPRLQLSPSCYSPLIQADEPTQQGTITSALAPGNAFGNPETGLAPSGLLTESINYGGFWGPAPAAASCPTFVLRQQIGHFLFLLDETNSAIVVVNSNRMSVIKKIPVVSPRDLAISPDMNILAVSNNSASTVTFIDADPFSPTFLEVIKVVSLVDDNNRRALGPTELVWQGQGEDVIAICDRSDSMAIIAGNGLEVRKIVNGVQNAKLVAATDRSSSVYNTGLYYAYVLQQNGDMKIFESGPDGLQGIGFDEFIGSPTLDNGRTGFNNPSAILINPGSSKHSVFVAYSTPEGAIIDDVWLDSAPSGPVTIRVPPGFGLDPNRRDKIWMVIKQYKNVFSSSSILDLAIDDLNNFGAISTTYSIYAGQDIVPHSSKALSRPGPVPVSTPRFLFAASSAGFIDVLNITAGTAATTPIRAEGVTILSHYWRQ